MPALQQINRTIANYKAFPNMSFPIECDGLLDSQMNDALLSVLGNIGGDKYILTGLTALTNYSGYVFVKTIDFPMGELLYVESASAMQTHLCVRKVNETVTANGYPYVNAYTKCTLYHGIPAAGVESFARSEFAQLKTNQNLDNRLTIQENRTLSAVPTGGIIMWSGTVDGIPVGWHLCDGTGGTPDLRGRFVVGSYRANDIGKYQAGDKNEIDKNTVTLEVSNLPSHRHPSEGNVPFVQANGRATVDSGSTGRGLDESSRQYNNYTGYTGDGLAFDIRPSYYSLAYIMKL